MQSLQLLVCTALWLSGTGATPILYPGLNPRDTYLTPNDDSYTNQIPLPASLQLFGTQQAHCYVDNNGLVSFNEGVGTFTPYLFTTATSNPMLGVWFADVDTRAIISQKNQVSYRFADTADLNQMRNYLGKPNLQHGFIATWYEVGYFNQRTDKLNTFQMVVGWEGTSTYVCYFYEKLEWTTGDASDGQQGLGGTPAVAGFTDGQGVAYNLPGSGSSAVLELARTSGGTLTPQLGLAPGVWCFDVGSRCSLTCLSDGNPCTIDACDQNSVCRHTPVAAGTACALNAQCNAAGVCECQTGFRSSNANLGCSAATCECAPVNEQCQAAEDDLDDKGSIHHVSIQHCTNSSRVAFLINQYGLDHENQDYGCHVSDIDSCNLIACTRFVPQEAYNSLGVC